MNLYSLPGIWRLVSAIVISLFLAGCGGDTGSSSSSSPISSSPASSSESSVQSSAESSANSSSETASSSQSSSSVAAPTFYRGVDLSYVNEMEACGVVYREGEATKDPYLIFADHGANLVRLRLWHTPDWLTAAPEAQVNNFSNLADVKIAIARAKAQGLQVLLNFHYSDTWADPGRQNIPAAWATLANDTEALSQAVYHYTYDTLFELNAEGLMPDMVQVGNETNGNMMVVPGSDLFPVDWTRNSALLNAGISAVRAAGNTSSIQPKIMLHVAEPENIRWWFNAATGNGVTDFDIIGISYYSAWSDYSVAEVAELVEDLVAHFEREVIIVETGLSWTGAGIDNANDILMRPYGTAELSPELQAQWLIDLTTEMFNHGGSGVVYWEPAWVSTDCYTQWGQGSHWEINTFFDFEHKLIPEGGIRFLSHDYQKVEANVSVTFSVDMSGVDGASEAFISGDFTNSIIAMEAVGDGIYSYTTELPAHSSGRYYFLTNAEIRETVPESCNGLNHSDRHYHLGNDGGSYLFPFAGCEITAGTSITFRVDMSSIAGAEAAYITGEFPGDYNWAITPMTAEGNNLFRFTIDVPPGFGGA